MAEETFSGFLRLRSGQALRLALSRVAPSGGAQDDTGLGICYRETAK